MHKVVVNPKETVCVKCSSCKESLEIQSNRHNHPVTMAFVHPRQMIRTKCMHCAKELLWSPEDLIPQSLKLQTHAAMA